MTGSIGEVRTHDFEARTLHLTRCLGHSDSRSLGTTAEPDVCTCELRPQHRFLILATQGVWKFLSKQEAVNLASSHNSAEDASWELVSEARRRAQLSGTMLDHNNVHCEDATAIVVYFEQFRKGSKPLTSSRKSRRKMTFQGQSVPFAIDVPSDLVSSNFDLWMQQEEARVQVRVRLLSVSASPRATFLHRSS
jgi:serine/threonine protein phosphatase PrpC